MSNTKGYSAFCEYVKNKSISLIGIGVSNLPLVSFLLNAGAKSVVVRDLKKTEESPEIVKAKKDGARVILGENYLADLSEDIVIRSPVIRPDITPFAAAEKNGTRITCETELFMEFCPCKTFAVTGSDGKTTTTTLIAKILSAAGWKVHLGGNIGKAMLPQIAEITSDSDVAVTELSSFQLMNCAFSPSVAVITNLSENHLDWHVDMNEYLDAKKNILNHQASDGIAVLNFENAHTRACACNGSVTYFSSSDAVEKNDDVKRCIYLKDGVIFEKENGASKKLFEAKEILLPGKHNVENYMTAIAATRNFAKIENVLEIANTFGGVEHRIELTRVLNGVKYYNSSIDSSPSRSTACLRAFDEKIIMIAGGYDKNLDYTPLGDEICKKVKTLILCGQTSEKIKVATEGSDLYQPDAPKILRFTSFEEAVKVSKEIAKDGDIVVLSPASASFDLFKNFEERGNLFKKIVSEF